MRILRRTFRLVCLVIEGFAKQEAGHAKKVGVETVILREKRAWSFITPKGVSVGD